MSWTDEEIDKLFQDRANDLSFEYKDEYWNEFSAALPVVTPEASAGNVAENEIDQMYQEQAKELSFEYKNAYWEEMEAMLSRRRNRDFLWFATAVLFIGLLSSTMFIGQPDSMAAHGDGIVAEETGSVINADNTQSAAETQDATGTTSTTTENVDANTVNGTTQDSGNNAASPTSTSGSNRGQENDVLVNNNSSATGGNANNPSSPAVVTNNTGANVNPVSEMPTSPIVVIACPPGRRDIISRERIAPRIEAEEMTIQGMETDQTINDLATNRIEQSEIDKEIVGLLPDDFTIADLKLPTRSVFYFELNGGVSQSLITPSDRLSYSGGFGIGAQFQKGRFSFTTGVNGICSFHDDIVLSRQAKVYGFGSQVYNYTLKYDQIYSLEGVLALGYRFGNHQINLGVRPSYVISSKVGFTQMSDKFTELERHTVYGHMDGIQRFGLKPMIGYSVDFRGNFTLGLNIGAQVMPSVNEEYINGQNNKLPIDGQLYLRKTIRFRR